jgi:hypothetical protein
MRLAVGHADEHESAAPEIARLRMNDGERKAGSHGRVHGIAARLHHLYSSPGSELMHAGHHRSRRVHRMHGRGGCDTRQREHYKERNQQIAMGSHGVGNGWNGRLTPSVFCRTYSGKARWKRLHQADL